MLIKSLQYDQQQIINDIISLYISSKQIDIDPCYSKGVFYSNDLVPQPVYKYDIEPIQGVEYADCRHLPLADSSVNSIIFDPPFLATTGTSLHKADANNIINKRFGVYESEKALHQMYNDSLGEFWRLLKPDGVLIFKCQDKVSSGKQYMTHTYVMNMAEKIGFYAVDLFILGVNNRLVAEWQTKNQQHARKYHSYFWVFKKPKGKRKMAWEEIERWCEK